MHRCFIILTVDHGSSPTILLWGWDWDHQSYEFSGGVWFFGYPKKGTWFAKLGFLWDSKDLIYLNACAKKSHKSTPYSLKYVVVEAPIWNMKHMLKSNWIKSPPSFLVMMSNLVSNHHLASISKYGQESLIDSSFEGYKPLHLYVYIYFILMVPLLHMGRNIKRWSIVA